MSESFGRGIATAKNITKANEQVGNPVDEFRLKDARRLLKSWRRLSAKTCRTDSLAQSIIQVPTERFFITLMRAQKLATKSLASKVTGEKAKTIGVLQSMCAEDGILARVQQDLCELLSSDSDLGKLILAMHGHDAEAYSMMWRRYRGVIIRLSCSFEARIRQVMLKVDPLRCLGSLNHRGQDRVTFSDTYLKKCKHCLHVFFGQKIIDRGISLKTWQTIQILKRYWFRFARTISL